MTHPLITFLKPPMAAPETPRLRHMRRWWMALCWMLALGREPVGERQRHRREQAHDLEVALVDEVPPAGLVN